MSVFDVCTYYKHTRRTKFLAFLLEKSKQNGRNRKKSNGLNLNVTANGNDIDRKSNTWTKATMQDATEYCNDYYNVK